MVVNIDDIYMQVGSRARVEIGNHVIINQATHREIQRPLDWNEGLIIFQFNQGGFIKAVNKYAFIVDAEGVANQGFLLDLSDFFQDDIFENDFET